MNMDKQDLKSAILWLELLKTLTVLFALGFSMGLQAKFFHYHPPVVQVYHESGK